MFSPVAQIKPWGEILIADILISTPGWVTGPREKLLHDHMTNNPLGGRAVVCGKEKLCF